VLHKTLIQRYKGNHRAGDLASNQNNVVLVNAAEPNAINTNNVSTVTEESDFKINARPLPCQQYFVS